MPIRISGSDTADQMAASDEARSSIGVRDADAPLRTFDSAARVHSLVIERILQLNSLAQHWAQDWAIEKKIRRMALCAGL